MTYNRSHRGKYPHEQIVLFKMLSFSHERTYIYVQIYICPVWKERY